MSGDGNTTYRMKMTGPEGSDPEFIMFKAFKACDEMRHYLTETGTPKGNGHDWHDLEDEMCAVSAAIPGVLFEIHERGTYDGEVFEARYYFRDGKSTKIEPEVQTVWPEFNEGMLA